MSHLFQRAKRFPTYIHHLPFKHTYKQLNLFHSQYHPIISINNTKFVPNTLSPIFCCHKFCTSSSKTPPDGQQLSSSNNTLNATSHLHPTPQMLTREHLQRSFRRAQRWFTIRILMVVAGIIGTAMYCWDHPNELINLKTRISKLFSDVGTSTLSQKELQIQATEYSKRMIKDVFNDPVMQQETKQFLISIVSQQDFLNTITELLRDLFQRDIMIESVKQLVIDVFDDESVIEQCKILVGHAISAEENKEILLKTLHDIFDDDELKQHMNTIANDTVKGVLNDEDVKELSIMFLKHILNEESVQQSSSDSLYKVFVGAMTPNMFKKKKKGRDKEVIIMDSDKGEMKEDNVMVEHVPHKHFEVENIDLEGNDEDVVEDVNLYVEGEYIQEQFDEIEDQADNIENIDLEGNDEDVVEDVNLYVEGEYIQEQFDEIEDQADNIENVIGNHH
eukprot:465884_1